MSDRRGCDRSASATSRLNILVATLLPLCFGLHWVAVSFPISEYGMSQGVKWVDDSVVEIRHEFTEGNYRWPSSVVREYRLDTRNGWLIPTAESFNPGGLELGMTSPYQVPGCDSSVARFPYEQITELAPQIEVAATKPNHADVDLVILFDGSEQELTRWELRESQKIEFSDRFIISETLDGSQVIARDALSGNVIASFPLSNGNSNSPLEWQAYGAIVEVSNQSSTLAAYDVRTGNEFPIQEAWQGIVFDVWEDEYLTVENKDYLNYPQNWPPTLEIR